MNKQTKTEVVTTNTGAKEAQRLSRKQETASTVNPEDRLVKVRLQAKGRMRPRQVAERNGQNYFGTKLTEFQRLKQGDVVELPMWVVNALGGLDIIDEVTA